MKFSDKKPKANYPQLGKQYEINMTIGYVENPDIKGKFLVHLKQGGCLDLWESQLDQLVLITQGIDKGTVKIIFEDVSTVAGKTKLMPMVAKEEF